MSFLASHRPILEAAPRITVLRMRPLTLIERGHPPSVSLGQLLDGDMDVSGLKVRRPETVRGWLRAYAAAVSTTTSAEKIRRAATQGDDRGLPRSTTQPYVETLTTLRLLDDVPAWLPGHNHLRWLTQGPKHHLADPALAANLVGHSREKLLASATPPVRVFAQRLDAKVFHGRSAGGA